jgi:hypothetical protein
MWRKEASKQRASARAAKRGMFECDATELEKKKQ